MVTDQFKGKIKNLKSEGKWEEALELLQKEYQKTIKRDDDLLSNSDEIWPFEQAAIVARKLKRYDQEIQSISQFLKTFVLGGAGLARMAERLARAYELNGKRIMPNEIFAMDLFIHRACIIDVETTGLSYQDEIIELGILSFTFNNLTGEIITFNDEYTSLREPTCPIHPGASRINGLHLNDVIGHKPDLNRVSEIIKPCKLAIAHNALFDRRFFINLVSESRNLTWLCTMDGIDWRSKGFSNRKLSTVIHNLNIYDNQSHRALDDVKAIFSMLKMIDPITERYYLCELLQSNPVTKNITNYVEYESNYIQERSEMNSCTIQVNLPTEFVRENRYLTSPKKDYTKINCLIYSIGFLIFILFTIFITITNSKK